MVIFILVIYLHGPERERPLLHREIWSIMNDMKSTLWCRDRFLKTQLILLICLYRMGQKRPLFWHRKFFFRETLSKLIIPINYGGIFKTVASVNYLFLSRILIVFRSRHTHPHGAYFLLMVLAILILGQLIYVGLHMLKRMKPWAGINLLLSKFTKGITGLDVPIRWVNRY